MDLGYDKDRFPSLTGDQFDCLVCQQVVNEPKECMGCGSMFCASCIDSWLKKKKECPNRCSAANTKIQKLQSKALIRIYNDIDIRCQFFNKCKKICKLGDLRQHEEQCQIPDCLNFQICQKRATIDQPTCSPACLLLTQIKSTNDDKQRYQFITSFIKDIGVIQKVQSGGVQGKPKGHSWVWSQNMKGTGIELSNGNLDVWLKESAYMFRTLLGDTGFQNGCHYWEIIADERTENELKIGIATKSEFNYNSAFCDYEFGYAFYGLGQLRHNSNASGGQYGKRFKKEGVLGCFLNMNKGTMSFSLNGESFGIAYQNDNLKKGPIFPAISLLHCAGCKLDASKPIPSVFNM